MLAIKMRGRAEAKEELGAISVGAAVRHGEDAALGVAVGEALVGKAVTIDRLATSAVPAGEVTALGHEATNDAVELGVGKAEAHLASAELHEVVAGAREIIVHLEDHAANGGTANRNVHIATTACHFDQIL